MFPVYFPDRLVFDRPIRLLSIRGAYVILPAFGGGVMPAGSGFIPGRMPFPVRKISRCRPRGTDGIVVQVPRSVVKYSNSDSSLQMRGS